MIVPRLLSPTLLLSALALVVLLARAAGDAPGDILAREDFDGDLSRWVVEQTPAGKTAVIDGRLDIDDAPGPNDKGGCTVWFKEKFSGPIMI
ncbi:MAG: hypothetical protein JHC85_13610, partial [Chthoniobacterales bacterium]|nr:hypothetical protein [Chthoniobacterales bacterium]